MAIKVIAQLREVKLGKNPGKKFVMRPDLYSPIQEKKVFAEASTHSGISAGVIKAAWDAAGEVIRTWATEGHSIPIPGLGTMRFGVRSKAVEKLEDVKTSLISVRRIIFTPNVDVKDELKNTSIQITCLDEEGNVLKRVTSGDSGERMAARTRTVLRRAKRPMGRAQAQKVVTLVATRAVTPEVVAAVTTTVPSMTTKKGGDYDEKREY